MVWTRGNSCWLGRSHHNNHTNHPNHTNHHSHTNHHNHNCQHYPHGHDHGQHNRMFRNQDIIIITIKGGEAKTRPHETLTNSNFKVLYRKKLYFLTTSVYCQHKFFELIQNTLFMDVKKIIILQEPALGGFFHRVAMSVYISIYQSICPLFM